MEPDGNSTLQAAFFREVLTADVAVGMGVVAVGDAAASLGRFWESDEFRVLRASSISDDDRARVEAEVERLVAESSGDVRAAVARRGVARELPSQMEAETAHALSDSGTRLRSPLRPLDSKRYMGFLPLGEGGMGVVYLALDTELNRRVAFKMIRAGTTDPLALESGPVADDAAARFVQEAVVTGGLEHPGIVPVYELGSTPAGVPYYTMRVVRGERTLADAIQDAKTLEDRLNLLESFLKICDTVGYAHSRGVIHRDLKPANVALGPYGEVVVLDWGLAKMTSRPDDIGTRWQARLQTLRAETSLKTLTSALGTPGYMAPEAALGKVQLVDEKSDVYSLGAILYRILTGEFPFEFRTFAEFIGGMRAGVSEVPGAPAGLAAICLSALAYERDDRCRDVNALAASVRSWMTESAIEREVDGLVKEAESALGAALGMEGDALLRQLDRAIAVSAQVLDLRSGHGRAESVRDQARALRDGAIAQRESIARRRLMKRVAIVGMALATAATIVVALLLDAKRREAEDARSREAEQRQLADQQRQLAEDERARAEDMARFMLTDLHEGLEPIGRLDLLGTVANKSLEYYEDLPEGSLTPDARRSRARALGHIAEVLLDTGNLVGSLKAARESEADFEALLASDPTNTTLQEDLAKAVNTTGDGWQESGDLDAAIASYRRSVELRRRLVPKDLARSLDRVAAVLMRQGERTGAQAAYEESLDIRRRGVADDPTDVELRRGLSVSLEYSGDLAVSSAGLTAALEFYNESLALRRQLVAENPNDAEARENVAAIVFRVAYCLNEQGDAAASRTHYEEALALYRDQSALNPSDMWISRNVALSLEALGNLSRAAGDADGALAKFREALAIKEEIASRDRSNTRARHDVGKANSHIGDMAKSAGDVAGALASYELAVGIARELVAESEDNTEWKDDLTSALFRVGQVYQLQKMLPEAQSTFEESLALCQQLAKIDPKNASWTRDVGLNFGRLGDIATALGHVDVARAHHTESLAVKRRLAELDAKDLTYQSDLLFGFGRLAAAARAATDEAAALALYEEAVPVHRRVNETAPTPARQREFSLCLYNIGTMYEAAGRAADALPVLREAESIHRVSAERADEHTWWSQALGRVALAVGPETPRDHLEAAYTLYGQKDYAPSADYFATALADDEIATDLVRGNRYNAVCSAALAGQIERAMKWLAADVQLRREKLTAEQRELSFEHARDTDPDLASLRALTEFAELFR